MAKKSPYLIIAEKLDQNPFTAPRSGNAFSKAFIDYLRIVFTPEEARLVQHLQLPPQFRTSDQIADRSGAAKKYVIKILTGLQQKGRILYKKNAYALPTIELLINFFQTYPEVKPDDIKAACLYQSFFISDGFYKYLEASEKGTPVFRALPGRKAIKSDQTILPAEEIHEFISSMKAETIALVPCACRTRTEKLDIRECKKNNPIGYCIMLGPSARYFLSCKLGKSTDKSEAIQYVNDMQKLGLVALTDNSIAGNTAICLCCPCCCFQLRGRSRWKNPHAILPANFVAQADEHCIFCGNCVDICPVHAISLQSKTKRAVADPEKCIGCGACVLGCPENALWLVRYERSTPFVSREELLKTIGRENKQ